MATHLVTPENGPRPAGKPNECFYCEAKLGEEHRVGCVLRTKRVAVRAVIEYEVMIPEHWGKHEFEFSRNESSWCSDNMLGELNTLIDGHGCLCPFVRFEYARDSCPRIEETEP